MKTLLLMLFTATALYGDRPNIVFLLVDDMGYGDIGCYGAPDAKTPNLDRFASEGVRFTQFYSNGAECTPARTAFLTGRYPQRVGGMECAIGTGNVGRYDDAIRLAGKRDLGLPAAEATLVPGLKKAGYRTAVYGKWHLGYEPKFNPLSQGFDEFVGFLGGNIDYFTHTELSALEVFYRDREPIREAGYMTHLITEDAVGFIDRSRGKPFFLYVPFSTPHFPFQGPKDDTGGMHPADQFTIGTREKYVEMLEDMDTSVGRILAAIDEAGMRENTLVVFASDHGAMKPGRNAPFAGWKGGLMEGGIRIPVIARWPGHLPAGKQSGQTATLMDLSYSFLRVGGGSPERAKLDGMDILGHVETGSAEVARSLYWRARRGNRTWRAIRDGDLKYVSHIDTGVSEQHLYDLAADPGEEKDLLRERPEAALRLHDKLVGWEGTVAPRR